jgi:hypothetical protein
LASAGRNPRPDEQGTASPIPSSTRSEIGRGLWAGLPAPGPVYEHLPQPRQLTSRAEHDVSTARECDLKDGDLGAAAGSLTRIENVAGRGFCPLPEVLSVFGADEVGKVDDTALICGGDPLIASAGLRWIDPAPVIVDVDAAFGKPRSDLRERFMIVTDRGVNLGHPLLVLDVLLDAADHIMQAIECAEPAAQSC